MKKFRNILQLLLISIVFISCNGKQEGTHFGVDAKIVDIDKNEKVLTIEDADENEEDEIFGKSTKIDCKDSNVIYCDYKKLEVKNINFEDLVVGDDIILEVKDSELLKLKDNKDSDETIKVNQVQLGTQRLE